MVAAVNDPKADTVGRSKEGEGVGEALEVSVGAENWGDGVVDRVVVATPVPVKDPELKAVTLGLWEKVPAAVEVAQGVGVSVTPVTLALEEALGVRVDQLPVALAVPLPPPSTPLPEALKDAVCLGDSVGESVRSPVRVPEERALPVAGAVPLTDSVLDRVTEGTVVEDTVAVVHCVRESVLVWLSDTV